MAILITNIGTSDLSIKITINEKRYYLPIDPLHEPNLDTAGLTVKEITTWKEPHKDFEQSGLYAELGFASGYEPNSRELTEKLLEQYKINPEYWHSRIQAPRILGVMKKAMSMGINQGYVFVTNQKSEKYPNGHEKDTCFLYEILLLWFEKNEISFDLIRKDIPANIPLNNPDLLFKFYFNFFSEIRAEDEKLKRQQRFPQVGNPVLCKVTQFHHNGDGIFVETNTGLKGFLNSSNITQDTLNLNQLRNIFQIGDDIWAKLIKREGTKLKFSTKELEAFPGEMLTNSQDVYERVKQEMALNYNVDVIDDEDMMLISVKGGTGQMKTALQLQGISVSAMKRLVFVDPQLSISSVFSGLSSDCKLESYWRYMRTQKYQTVRQLLERWDFDGAIQILKNWQDYLNYLINQGIVDKEEIEISNSFSSQIMQGLDFGRACFNLDFQTAKNIAQVSINNASSYPDFSNNIFHKLSNFADDYKNSPNKSLNLYTINRIYWELDQSAVFLAFISTFYEEILHGIIQKWEGRYDNIQEKWLFSYLNEKWEININRINRDVWNIFADIERDANPRFRHWENSRQWKYSLTSRYSKRNFIEALVSCRNNANETQAWNRLCTDLKQLDFWANRRNELIHSAKGCSKNLMSELYNSYTYNDREPQPCTPDNILLVMASIIKNELVGLKTNYANSFVGNDANHYIYSDVRDWVVRQLIQDGLQ